MADWANCYYLWCSYASFASSSCTSWYLQFLSVIWFNRWEGIFQSYGVLFLKFCLFIILRILGIDKWLQTLEIKRYNVGRRITTILHWMWYEDQNDIIWTNYVFVKKLYPHPSVLKVVSWQTVCWLGCFYCPLLPVIVLGNVPWIMIQGYHTATHPPLTARAHSPNFQSVDILMEYYWWRHPVGDAIELVKKSRGGVGRSLTLVSYFTYCQGKFCDLYGMMLSLAISI